MIPNIINIQRYAIHDGDGIRASVFFKGCPLRCAWCHNPESHEYKTEIIFDKSKCHGCQLCSHACQNGAIMLVSDSNNKNYSKIDRAKCTACGICAHACPYNALEICGKAYDIDTLVEILMRDRMFYELSGGGVTLTGGEVMAADMDYVEELLKRLKRNGVNTAIDTCGYAPYSNFERLLPYTDTFLFDIKHMNASKHLKYTGVDNSVILGNLKKLSLSMTKIGWDRITTKPETRVGALSGLIVRIPVVVGFNADAENFEAIIDYLKDIAVQGINLLPYHNTADNKYARLGLTYENSFKTPSETLIREFNSMFEQQGFRVV